VHSPCGFFCRRIFALSIAALFPFFSILSLAQQFTPNELTVGIDFQTYGIQTCTLIGSGPFCQPGTDHALSYSTPSFTYTRNLSPSLALEGTVQPTSPFRYNDATAAGRETLALGGVKTGWRVKRWGLYGEVQAGVDSFSCNTWNFAPKPYSNCARNTHFALEYGGVAEYHLSPRWALRADAGHLEIAQFDKILVRYSDGSPQQYMAGSIAQHLDARIGITRNFGKLEDARAERVPQKQSWDAGVVFALQPRIQPEFQFLDPYPEWGLWTSWNFSKHVSWDTTLLHSPRNAGQIESIDFQAGGRAFEALTGAKIGIRRDHMGYFAKVRPGTITFGKTERQINESPTGTLTFDNGMFTNFVLDTGGVFEVYPSRHSILRFDAASATIFYQPKTVIALGQKDRVPGQTQPSMFVSFGAGFRF
jgi:hypothetical protein